MGELELTASIELYGEATRFRTVLVNNGYRAIGTLLIETDIAPALVARIEGKDQSWLQNKLQTMLDEVRGYEVNEGSMAEYYKEEPEFSQHLHAESVLHALGERLAVIAALAPKEEK